MKKSIPFLFFVVFLINGIAQTPFSVAENFGVKSIEGETLNLYDILDEGQYALIDFFDISCGPCQVFASDVQVSYESFGLNEEDVFYMGISYSGDNATIHEWDSIYGIQYPTVSGFQGGGNNVYSQYEILSTPTILLVAPNRDILGQVYLPDFVPQTTVIDSMIMANGIMPTFTSTRGLLNGGLNEKIIVYPNPAHETISMNGLNADKDNTFLLTVMNISGQKILEPFLQNTQQVSVKEMPDGFYFLNLHKGNVRVYSEKLLVQ
jgi:hypothetical protein